jgi:hypothetical protein
MFTAPMAYAGPHPGPLPEGEGADSSAFKNINLIANWQPHIPPLPLGEGRGEGPLGQ